MRERKYEIGSRNVFKDLGLPNAEEHLVKAQLVFKIDAIMKRRRLKQIEAATLFGTRQPDVSGMLRGDFRQFSVERLLRFLVRPRSGRADRRKAPPQQRKRPRPASLLSYNFPPDLSCGCLVETSAVGCGEITAKLVVPAFVVPTFRKSRQGGAAPAAMVPANKKLKGGRAP